MILQPNTKSPNYLKSEQLEHFLSLGKSVEYWLGAIMIDGYETFKWLSIVKDFEVNGKYSLVVFHVFNDKEEGLNFVYDFSPVEPDELYGKIIDTVATWREVLWLAESVFQTRKDQFCPEGYMNDFLISH